MGPDMLTNAWTRQQFTFIRNPSKTVWVPTALFWRITGYLTKLTQVGKVAAQPSWKSMIFFIWTCSHLALWIILMTRAARDFCWVFQNVFYAALWQHCAPINCAFVSLLGQHTHIPTLKSLFLYFDDLWFLNIIETDSLKCDSSVNLTNKCGLNAVYVPPSHPSIRPSGSECNATCR